MDLDTINLFDSLWSCIRSFGVNNSECTIIVSVDDFDDFEHSLCVRNKAMGNVRHSQHNTQYSQLKE